MQNLKNLFILLNSVYSTYKIGRVSACQLWRYIDYFLIECILVMIFAKF